MTSEMKNQIFKTLDLFDTKEFEEVKKMKAFSYIKDFKSVYNEWRQAYLKCQGQHINISLEEYCKDVERRAKDEITQEQVKIAILMKRNNCKSTKIAKETGIKYQKLHAVFADARMHELLEIKEKRNES